MSQPSFDLALSFEGHPVHVLFINGQPAWLAQEVGDVLGIADAANVLRKNPQAEKGIDYDVVNRETLLANDNISLASHVRTASIVWESGLLVLILRSRKPNALAFGRWVIREVLPSIRSTGSYSLVPAEFSFDGLTRQQLKLIELAGKGNGYARAILEAKGLRPAEGEGRHE